MGTARLFSYNLSSNGIITGCTQFGNMAVSLNTTYLTQVLITWGLERRREEQMITMNYFLGF